MGEREAGDACALGVPHQWRLIRENVHYCSNRRLVRDDSIPTKTQDYKRTVVQ